MVRNGILIFNSVHKVMRAEKLLKRAGFDVRIMPVPRQLSSDCGLSVAFRLEDAGLIDQTLEGGDCPAEGRYRLEAEKYLEME